MLEHYIETKQQRSLKMQPLLQGTPKERLWVLWSATADQVFRDYDWAVRMWGMHDPHVAAVLEQIDAKRMEVLIGLFMELGIGEERILESVSVGQMVEKGAGSAMRDFTRTLLGKPSAYAGCCPEKGRFETPAGHARCHCG